MKVEEREVIDICEYTKQWQAHGKSQGELKKAIKFIRNLMNNSHVIANVAMNMLGISH